MIKTDSFLIDKIFNITGRGTVFAGRIIEGTVSVGNQIEFKLNNQVYSRRINGVEMIRHSNPEMVNVGLLIETMNENEVEEWKSACKSDLKSIIYSKSLE